MGWRFRRTVKIFPGMRMNITQRGVSFTTGMRGAHVTAGKRGLSGSIGIPGTGLSYNTRFGGGRSRSRSGICCLGCALPVLPVIVLSVIALSKMWRSFRSLRPDRA
jgi:hypothetical protein